MNVFDALLLGLIQGCTELLPVSSSGHLALAERYFAVQFPQGFFGFDVLLHAGSLLALVFCFGKMWMRLFLSPFIGDRDGMRMLAVLVVVTIPAGVIGVFFGESLDSLRSLPALAAGFLVSGIVLVIAERVPGERSFASLKLWEVLCIGIAQACALAPSVSRSGATIAACRGLRLKRSEAVDFAFLMAVPAIAGATLFTAIKAMKGSVAFPPLAVSGAGFLASFGASILAVLVLRTLVQRWSTAWFALYLIPLAVFLLVR